MPKQQNGLTCYIHQTLLPELQRQGRHFPNGIADVIPIAIPRFKNLPPEEKRRYEEMAKNLKRNPGSAVAKNPARRDNCGNVIAQRRDPRQLMLQKRKDDRAAMRQHFPRDDDIVDYQFYIIGFEYMVEVEDPNEFMPVEVGLVEWSMRDGISNYMHEFINPGNYPLGYRFKCQEHAEETHHIPLEKIGTFSKDYSSIWAKINSFIKPQGDDLTVYCMENEYEKIDGCLTWLHQHSNSGGRPITFHVRFLEDLASELYSHEGKNIAEASITEMLTTTGFDYVPNTSCQFHEENECKYCALGAARRYAYALSDAMKVIYDFELTDRHLPTITDRASSFVVTGPDQQLMERGLSGLPAAPKGHGRPTDSTGFGCRDIRYPPTQGEHFGSVSGQSWSSSASLGRGYCDSASQKAPLPSQHSAPSFKSVVDADDFARPMSSMSLVSDDYDDAISEYSVSSSAAAPSMPKHTSGHPNVYGGKSDSVSSVISAMLAQPKSPVHQQQQSESVMGLGSSSAPGLGVAASSFVSTRGRGISGPPSLWPASGGRGIRPPPQLDPRPLQPPGERRIPPGFGGRGAAFY